MTYFLLLRILVTILFTIGMAKQDELSRFIEVNDDDSSSDHGPLSEYSHFTLEEDPSSNLRSRRYFADLNTERYALTGSSSDITLFRIDNDSSFYVLHGLKSSNDEWIMSIPHPGHGRSLEIASIQRDRINGRSTITILNTWAIGSLYSNERVTEEIRVLKLRGQDAWALLREMEDDDGLSIEFFAEMKNCTVPHGHKKLCVKSDRPHAMPNWLWSLLWLTVD